MAIKRAKVTTAGKVDILELLGGDGMGGPSAGAANESSDIRG